jgi:hypothetical protein
MVLASLVWVTLLEAGEVYARWPWAKSAAGTPTP